MNTNRVILLSLMIPVLLLGSAAEADREPVLSQITAPHNYYFREMYLPRVTTGPSSPAWMPSGRELVYSMQGSLWRQSIDSETAVQITDGDGYDSQPDVAPVSRVCGTLRERRVHCRAFARATQKQYRSLLLQLI